MVSTTDRAVISVSELNSQAKEVLELLNYWVEGEVSGFKPLEAQRYYYVYFSLQDTSAKAVVQCAMRREAFASLGIDLADGQKILVQGKMSLMTQSGRAAFMVNAIELAGQGKMAAEIEKLKRVLQAEGLLSDERKRPLPKLPSRIGVVTSVHSDAWEDFKRHSIAKFPNIELVVADSFVQGQRAPHSLVVAIEALQQQAIDILVITRGGGSAEDLAAFNDEKVVRAIANSKIPTVVGVGHEKDVSVADLVSDVRASTPTNAGQIVTQYYEEATVNLQRLPGLFDRCAIRLFERYFQRLDEAAMRLQRSGTKYQALPHQLAQIASSLARFEHQLIQQNTSTLDSQSRRLNHAGMLLLWNAERKLAATKRHLDAVSPVAILSRGYSIVRSGGAIVRSSDSVESGQVVDIKLAKGRIEGTITQIHND